MSPLLAFRPGGRLQLPFANPFWSRGNAAQPAPPGRGVRGGWFADGLTVLPAARPRRSPTLVSPSNRLKHVPHRLGLNRGDDPAHPAGRMVVYLSYIELLLRPWGRARDVSPRCVATTGRRVRSERRSSGLPRQPRPRGGRKLFPCANRARCCVARCGPGRIVTRRGRRGAVPRYYPRWCQRLLVGCPACGMVRHSVGGRPHA